MSDGLHVDLPDENSGSIREAIINRAVPMGKFQSPEEYRAAQEASRVDTLTVILMAHHSPANAPTESAEIKTAMKLADKEQMYKRIPRNSTPVGKTVINTGWIERPGYVLIHNQSDPPIEGQLPSIVRIGVFEAGPNGVIFAMLAEGQTLEAEVINAPALISITCFPR